MSFKESDKVVCVIDAGLGISKEIAYPNGAVVKGRVYCVSGIKRFPFATGVTIVGHPALWTDGDDIGFAPNRFLLLADVKAENARAGDIKIVNLKINNP